MSLPLTNRAADAANTGPSQGGANGRTSGELRREQISRDPRFLDNVRAAKKFYEERGIAT